MSNITQMDLIKAEIEYGNRGTSNKDITKNILEQWRGSQKIKDMIEADLYYKVQNTKIEEKTRDYEDPETHNIIQNNTLSNIKSRTAKYRKQIDEKANFVLNKPFVISCDNDKYKKAWEEFLDKGTRKVISRTGKQAINKGIAFQYIWIDKEGNLKIIDTISETIYPAWSDTAHTDLDAVVRDYTVTEYIDNARQDKRMVEFWDRKIFQQFIDYGNGEGSGDLVDVNIDTQEDSELSERAAVINTHMVGPKGEGISWDRVPFIALKGVEDELPALNICKSDIDSYDLVKSKGIDSILDDIDAVLVVKNISPELNELANARRIIQNSRIVSVEQDGDAKFEKVDIDVQAIRDELDIIKKDIINDTNTVDMTTIEFGSNPSSKAMRMFFTPLNQWANGFEEEFRVYFENLKYFFDKWLSWKGGFGSFEELQKIKIEVSLDRDMLVDETDIIDNIVKLQTELSQRTRDELNPYIDDPEREQKRREEDRQKEKEEMELYGFEQDIVNNEEDNENQGKNEETE